MRVFGNSLQLGFFLAKHMSDRVCRSRHWVLHDFLLASFRGELLQGFNWRFLFPEWRPGCLLQSNRKTWV